MCVNIECLRHILMLNCFSFVGCGFFGGVRCQMYVKPLKPKNSIFVGFGLSQV